MLGRKPSPKLYLLPAIGLLCCLHLQAQGGPGSIQGRVFLRGGEHPNQRVLVSLQFRGAPMQSSYTDDEGRFSFYELINNPYRVVIQEEGYEPVSHLVVVRADISPITIVTIILRRLTRDPSEPSPPGAVSGGNPHVVSVESYRKEFPRKAVKEFEAGRKQAEKGKIERAVKHYNKALEVAPDFYPAHNNLGAIHLSRKEFEKAEEAFRECIRLNEADANAYFNLGNVFLLTQRFSEAEDILRQGLLRQSLSALGHYLLGTVQVRRQRFVPGEQALLKARQLDPAMPSVRLELVNLYLMQQRREDAMREIREFITLFPDQPVTKKLEAFLNELESAAAR
jgi:Flp pilus assembly protein TadD